MKPEDIKVKTLVSVTAQIEFSEGELRALDAMVGYGIKPFLEVFYAKLGKAYMQPYEADLRALFIRVNETVPDAIRRVEKMRALTK